MVPNWLLQRDSKSPTNLALDLQTHKEKWESEQQQQQHQQQQQQQTHKTEERREDEKNLKLPSLHHLFDDISAPPSALFSHSYPPFKATPPSSQSFHLGPPSSSKSHLSNFHHETLTQKEASDLYAFRQHDAQRYSSSSSSSSSSSFLSPFDSGSRAPSLRDPYGRLSPPPYSPHSSHYSSTHSHSSRHSPPSHSSSSHSPSYSSSHSSSHSHSSYTSPLLNLIHPTDDPPSPFLSSSKPSLSPPSSSSFFSSSSLRSSSDYSTPRHADLPFSETRGPYASVDLRNTRAEIRSQNTDFRTTNTDLRNYKNTDFWATSSYSSTESHYPYKFHPSHEPLLKEGYRSEKASPHFSYPTPSLTPTSSLPLSPSLSSSSSTYSQKGNLDYVSGHAPTYGEFEENEYNLRIKSPSGQTTTPPAPPTLSPEQKRRRRIINKALSKGQMIARAQAQSQTGTRGELSPHESKENEEGSKPARKRHVTQSMNPSKRRSIALLENASEVICTCENPPSGIAVECDGCQKWFHIDCVVAESEFMCAVCKSENRKKARTDQDPSAKETSETTDPIDLTELIEEEETGGIRVGNEVVSLSTLAKQPWIDGWATARVLAVQYLQEAKKLGNEITENRKLPKQISVRMSTKGKRPWRQAEVLLAIQFLKTSELVETSTRKGTLVREPFKTMDDLIARALSVPMPTTVTSKSRT